MSAEFDAATGAAVTLIAVDAIRHVRDRRDLGLALLPLALGAHLLIEVFVWLGLDGSASRQTLQTATSAYLAIAFLLPVAVPAVVAAHERMPSRRRFAWYLAGLGAVDSAILLGALASGPATAATSQGAVAYSVGIPIAGPVIAAYVLATCGSLLASSDAAVARFGAANLFVVPLIGWLSIEAFVSLWCAWAAIISVGVALHLRSYAPEEETGMPLATGP